MLLSRHTRRREVIALLGGAARPSGAQAQTTRKIPRTGVLWRAASAEVPRRNSARVERPRLHGGSKHHLGESVPSELPQRFVSLAAELADFKVDILVSINRNAALAAQRTTTSISIVFVAK